MPAVEALFDELLRRGASDLHLAVQHPPLARIRGDLVPLRDTALSGRDLEDMLLEVISPAQRARLATNLDVGFAIDHRDGVRFRARYFLSHVGMSAVFRLVPARVPAAREIGLPASVTKLAEVRAGLVVVAGPASSGKTTTAAVMLDHLNQVRRCHVVTIEAPIEFVHESRSAQFTQREVGDHVASLLSGLANVGRENADVVFVSELSLGGEIELALKLADQGALVITTVEAGSAISALERLVNGCASDDRPRIRALLADCLVGVIEHEIVRSEGGSDGASVRKIIVGTPAPEPLAAKLRPPAGRPPLNASEQVRSESKA